MAFVDSLLTEAEDKLKLKPPYRLNPEEWFDLFREKYGSKLEGSTLRAIEDFLLQINCAIFMEDIVT